MKKQTMDEWLRLPVNERAAILTTKSASAFDNYVRVTMRLRRRFSRKTGYFAVDINGKPAPYRILEDMAWIKYVVLGQ